MSKSISAAKTYGARWFWCACVLRRAEQFCRRSAKLSNIPCQLPAKLEMKFPFPGAAPSRRASRILIDTLSKTFGIEMNIWRWDETEDEFISAALLFISGVELSWRWRKKREISSPGCCSAEWVLYHHLLYQMAVLTGWLCPFSVLKERKLPAGKYFIISHSGSNLIKGALAQTAARVKSSYVCDVN